MTIRPSVVIGILGAVFLMAASAAEPDRGEALREAARAGDLEKVRSLLDAGVPVDSPGPRHGHTALLFAADGGHLAVVELLVSRGADVNAMEGFFKVTPLLAALGPMGKQPTPEHGKIALLLLSKGAKQADSALVTAIQKGDLDLARAALATGRLTPLDLKAARKMADGVPNEALKTLLAEAKVEAPKRPPYKASPERLKACEGKFRGQGGEVTVAVKGDALSVSGGGVTDLILQPVEEGLFESADGTTAMAFAGRSTLIEWATMNRDGELLQLGMVTTTSDPLPMKKAEGAPADAAAPRTEARPWPQFRGPGASGIADGQGVPLQWSVSKQENIRFKTPVPGIALSSPVIWGDRIYLTTAVSEKQDKTFRTGLYGDATSVDDTSEHVFRLLALDAATGKVLWDQEVHRAQPTVRRHLKSSLANATPVIDGSRVVVLFGAVGVLAAYDLQGKQLWKTDVGILDCNDPQSGQAEWGHASSPILYQGSIILQADRRKDSFLAAYKLDSGAQVWRVSRDEPSTWTTPNIVSSPKGDELVTNGRIIRAYDPKTGSLLWSLGPNSEVIVATPVVADGQVYITAGYPPVRPVYAVRPGHRGDLTLPDGQSSSEAVAWSHQRGGTYIPTPILYRGHFYTIGNNGLLTCYDAATGKQVYQTRVGEMGASFSASPVAADGRLYFISETGDVFVLRAGPEFELLATNPMDEVVMATPAASNGLLVVRTLGHVVGIGASAGASGH
ncbi:MAG: PQQ-binding-like beta-propeller repeat protein [Candidatus Polarisedimenticolia bacterium]